MSNNPDVAAAVDPGAYQALVVTAARRADGGLDLFVVNLHPSDAVSTKVLTGLSGSGTATVTEVNGDDFTSYNSADQPDAVRLLRGEIEVSDGSFRHGFPPHSVSIVRLA